MVTRGLTVARKAPAASTEAVATGVPSAASIDTGLPAGSDARPERTNAWPAAAPSCGVSSSSEWTSTSARMNGWTWQ